MGLFPGSGDRDGGVETAAFPLMELCHMRVFELLVEQPSKPVSGMALLNVTYLVQSTNRNAPLAIDSKFRRRRFVAGPQ